MNKKAIVIITVAVVAIALVATGLVILMGLQAGKNPLTGTTGISIDQATSTVQNYLGKMGYSNLGIASMQEYSNMYYAQIVESNNGTGAFELAVNRTTGVVTPMQGATKMWNTKYGVTSTGMMGYLYSTSSSGGMMGGNGMMQWLRGTPTTNMAISMEQAKTIAQKYLDANYTGTTVGQVTTYYGYYTMQVLKDGNVVGMMGVYGKHWSSHELYVDGNIHATEGLWLNTLNNPLLCEKCVSKNCFSFVSANYLTTQSL